MYVTILYLVTTVGFIAPSHLLNHPLTDIDRGGWIPLSFQAFAQSLASSHLQKAVLFPQGLRKCLGLGDVRS